MTDDTQPKQAPRQLPPPLQIQYPLCGICGNEVSHDGDNWWCESCQAFWPEADEWRPGAWDNPDAERCASIDGRYLTSGSWARERHDTTLRQCLLDRGHEGDHHWNSAESHAYCWADVEQLRDGLESEPGVLPMHWWIAYLPVPVVYDPLASDVQERP